MEITHTIYLQKVKIKEREKLNMVIKDLLIVKDKYIINKCGVLNGI
jgi:hypothetical protein